MTRMYRTLCLVIPLTLILAVVLPLTTRVSGQSDLAALLEVFETGVEVKRVDTVSWVPISVESVLGSGDYIRTDATGRARITFFSDGTSVELEPNTEYHIIEFSGTEEQFTLTVEVLLGITQQQFARLVDPGSSYEVVTPGAAMVVRGTNFAIRVEDDGRSSVLTSEGLVEAQNADGTADVPPNYGLRADEGSLSDVVPATTFEELDAALDGCAGSVRTTADVRLNVRTGPSITFDRVASIVPESVTKIMAIDDSGGWYRIPFRGGYGWISAELMEITVDSTCALATYVEAHTEDTNRYSMFGDMEVNASVQGATANMRSGPSLEYDIVISLTYGEELIITGRSVDSDWLRVRTLDGLSGWIAAFLVDVDADLSQIGVVTVDEVFDNGDADTATGTDAGTDTGAEPAIDEQADTATN